jgi:hypothetical protein
MKFRVCIYRVSIFLVTVALSGCTTVPTKSKQTVADKPPAAALAAPQPTVSEPSNWKIPPRPSDEMKLLAPLEEITKLFRTNYASARSEVQHSQGAVVLTRFSGATLFRNGKIVETVRVIPAEYHNLRYAAHVPFMIFLKLHSRCGSPLDASTRTDIEKYMTTIQQAGPALVYTKLTEIQLTRQHRILNYSIAFLKEVLDAGKVETDQLRRFARGSSVDLEQNMWEAGAAQVSGLHEQMLKWRAQIPDVEWRNIRFVVHGPQQPRGGGAMTLYFSALLKDPGDGRGYIGESTRLVYREDTSLPSTNPPSDPWEADLELLAAIDLDSAASEAFFSDPERLAVDVVSDGARSRIRELDFSKLQ